MTHMTNLNELKQHITVLANVEESDELFISVYINLDDKSIDWRETLNKRTQLLRLILKDDDLADLNAALIKVETWMETELLREARSTAIFLRGDFMLPMQFAAPLPNWVVVYPTPNIYHLVELKDNYHRYIVLFAVSDRASIMEINLGAATTRAWTNNPDLRMRVAQEWTRPHFQVHQKHRGDQFLQEKIKILEQLMHAGGHTHLILAGDPKITEIIRAALPEDLAEKLVDITPTSERDKENDVVMETLSNFIENEEQESRSVLERLIESLRSQNLGVAGTIDTLAALRWGQVDTLVMASDYQPGIGWSCTACRAIGTESPQTSECLQCGAFASQPVEVREAMLHLAEQLNCSIEIVENSETLLSLGGVGCLLRSLFDTRNNKQITSKDVVV